MKAMLLAAGRGVRLRPLTDNTPKPLLKLGDQCLIERHLQMLHQQGFNELVINVSYLGEQIIQTLGDGSRYGVQIHWSHESGRGLETGGGIYKALTLLGNDVFLVINSDLYTSWQAQIKTLKAGYLAHLIMVENPRHHPDGDFFLNTQGQLSLTQTEHNARRLTFAGIGYYHPALFDSCTATCFKLASVLRPAILQSRVSGELFTGVWEDVGSGVDCLEAARHAATNN